MRDYLRDKYGKDENLVQYIGYCSDEEKRSSKKLYAAYDVECPLIKANITTEDALQICKDYGFDFGGIYDHHEHFNCWLCPLQNRKEIHTIWKEYLELWDKLRKMQFQTDGYYQQEMSVMDFDKRFWIREHKTLKQKRMDSRKKYNMGK